MTLPAPAPVKPNIPEKPGNGHRPPGGDGNGRDDGRGTGWPEEAPPPQFPSRRRSFWPILLDLGLAMALFGLIITGRYLVVIGAVVAVIALMGWIREARADYSRLRD